MPETLPVEEVVQGAEQLQGVNGWVVLVVMLVLVVAALSAVLIKLVANKPAPASDEPAPQPDDTERRLLTLELQHQQYAKDLASLAADSKESRSVLTAVQADLRVALSKLESLREARREAGDGS